jgi:hypothetical protein
VRRLGVRRRRRTSLVAVATAFVVVGAVAIVLGVGLPHGRPTDPATPTPPAATEAPPTFGKLAPVGSGIAYGTSKPPQYGTVTAMGDRAFVGWQDEGGQISVVAVDLTTGRAVWGPIRLGTFHDFAGVYWHPRYVLVMGRNDDGTKPDGAIVTLDPQTGRTLLHVDVDGFESDDIVLGETTLVIASRSDGITRGYDLGTGRVRWAVPDPPSRIVHSLPMQSAAGPPFTAQRNMLGGVPLATRQFVQLTADGTAIVRDLATGAEQARRTGAVSTVAADGRRDEVLAVDGTLYGVDHTTAATIRATNLTRKTAPATIYTAGNGSRIGPPSWCGPARICFSEQGDPSLQGLVGFDTDHRKVLWRQDGFVSGAQTVDGRVLVNYRDPPGKHRAALYDAAGRQILNDRAQANSAGWIDGGSALLFGQASAGQDTELLGVTPLDADPVPLGTISGNAGCGWNRTHLVCATATGVKVWQFAT